MADIRFELGDHFTIPVRVTHVEMHPSVRNAVQVHLVLLSNHPEPLTLVCTQDQVNPASPIRPMTEDEAARNDADDAARQLAETTAARSQGRPALLLPGWRDRAGSLSRTVPLA